MTEIRTRAPHIPFRKVTSLYFGGGTPSLMPTEYLLAISDAFRASGFEFQSLPEISIEINPGTIDSKTLQEYLAMGVNRFSVGVQTFSDPFLKACGREHSAHDSRETLSLLKKHNVNFSFDLLFGLPNQTLADLKNDLAQMLEYSPPHVSLYNLTVPKQHFMNEGRAHDETQAEMFLVIEDTLESAGIYRYEISNFAKPGFESRHNQIYWNDLSYWGLGVSSHSYLHQRGPYGTRFWNPSSYKEYQRQICSSAENLSMDFLDNLPTRQVEPLKQNEAFTDFCHTQLRLVRGLDIDKFSNKFGKDTNAELLNIAKPLIAKGLLDSKPHGFCLSKKAYPIANQIFLEFTKLNDI